MTRGMSRLAMVIGACGLAIACGGGTEPSITGPTPPPTSGSGAPPGGGSSSAIARVRCEQTSGRSKVSVDGDNLRAGMYQARISSGSNQAGSPAAPTVGDEVEFDFDSNANDIAAGATRIPASFIQDARVQGDLLDAAGTMVATATVNCDVR